MRISNRDLVHVYTMANNAALANNGGNPENAARLAEQSVEHFKRWAAKQPDVDDTKRGAVQPA